MKKYFFIGLYNPGSSFAIFLINRTERGYDDEEDTTKDSKGKDKAGPSEQKPIPESSLKPEVQVCLMFCNYI